MIKLIEHPFTRLDVESPEFKELEAFAISLYGNGADSLNELRKDIFCHRNQNPEMIPPTQNAFLQHCRRAVYQASIWTCANKAEINAPDPCNHGWKKKNQRLLPIWITIPEVSAASQW